MKFHRMSAWPCLLLLAACSFASAETQPVTQATLSFTGLSGSYTGSGNFTYDDDVQLINFSLSQNASVNLFTTSWASSTVNGFAPVLSLFSFNADPALSQLLAFDAGGVGPSACGARGVDSVLGLCLDAYISIFLPAGDYTLAVTQNDNLPSQQPGGGGTLADGFTRVDPNNPNYNFTAADCGQPTTSGFLTEGAGGCNPRTSAWELSIAAENTPEPSPALLTFSGIAVLSLVRRYRRRNVKV